jgi:hypothetical protein
VGSESDTHRSAELMAVHMVINTRKMIGNEGTGHLKWVGEQLLRYKEGGTECQDG